ncbi:MAG: co-chaperone YbbN [Blastopirellula sp.]|nr:co-chaperone YbbN [Blastopirellula sp.]
MSTSCRIVSSSISMRCSKPVRTHPMPEATNDWVVNTTDETFEKDVFQASQERLVVVDFWAAWCQPCRMLAPLLEKIAAESNGKFVLVKANTDETPQAAGQFQVSGIPAVYAVSGGEVVDFFQGVLPEDAILGWIDTQLERGALQQAINLVESAPEQAEAQLRQILADSPNESQAACALADALLRQDQDDACREVLEQLEARGFLEPAAEKIKAALDLKSKSGVDLDAVRAHAEAHPDDLTAQFALADALVGAEQYQDAFEICLKLVQQDRKGYGEQARALMVDVFRALPDDSELTSEYRRKLSTALY